MYNRNQTLVDANAARALSAAVTLFEYVYDRCWRLPKGAQLNTIDNSAAFLQGSAVMQPPNIPIPLKGKIGADIKNAGYAKSNDGKWSWNFGGGDASGSSTSRGTATSHGPPSLSRARSMASLDIFRGNAAPSVTHIAKELKVAHSATSRNIVGNEFQNAGKSELEIWRMENMTARSTPKEQYGKFYTGDAYIVLSAPGGRSSSYHIHFWIGKKSSQDKYGTAAYKTVELDNKFTGSAIHHREEQGKESELFKSYFPNGMEYLEGGSASSFRHVKREVFAKRLLHLKGRRSVKAKQVEATYKSLNMGDDVGRTIFQWNGPQASRTERVKGVELIRNIKDNERGGRATIIVVEFSDNEDKQNKKLEQFWEALGDKGPVAAADEGGDDDKAEKDVEAAIILTKVYEEKDQVKTEVVTTRPLKKEILDPHHAYVLDAKTEVFAWLGKSCSGNQKTFASDLAKKIHSGTVSWAPLVKIVQGAETPLFKEKFDNWKQLFPKTLDYGVSAQLLPSTARREFSKEDIDFDALITAKPKLRPENSLSHDGTGVLKIWKIEDFKKVEIPETQHGIFFSSSCYIVLYVEVKDGRRNHYIYFWQGRHATKENKGTSALLAKEMADAIRGKTQQFRVVHHREPEHFIMLFKGKMIVGMGEHPKSREDLSGLYHVKHHPNAHEWNVKAAQVPMTAEALNSNDSFVMLTADYKCFVWNGVGSSSLERKIAKLVAARIVGDANVGKIITVDENKEVSFFWPHFPGGKKEYANAEYLKWNSKSPRLFLCSNTTGTFKVEEIYNFTQEDLDIYDPFILDCYAEVYVWVGSRSNEQEKKFAMQTALEYVAKASNIDGRDSNTPIYYVVPGEEPIHFKCHFLAWDSDVVGDSKKVDDDDDGTPMKSSIIFKPAIVTSSDSTTRLHALKAAPAPDPNRPKLVFSHPVPAASSTSQTEEKKEVKPLSFSYPKPTADQTGSGQTTPRSFTYTTAPSTPRSSGASTPSQSTLATTQQEQKTADVAPAPTPASTPATVDETTSPTSATSATNTSSGSTASVPASVPTPVSTTPVKPTKPAFTINLNPLGSGSSSTSLVTTSTSAPSTPSSNNEPTTPGRSSTHTRPAYIKTKSEKIVATLVPASSPTTPKAVIYTTLISPRSSTPTSSTIVTLTPLSSSVSSSSSSSSSTSTVSASVATTAVAASTTPVLSGALASVNASISTSTASSSVPPSESPKSSPTTSPLSSPVLLSTRRMSSASSPSLLSLSSSPTPVSYATSSNSSGALKTSQEKVKEIEKNSQDFQKIVIKPKPTVGLVQVELAKYNREFYSLEELTARKKPPGVDVTCLEKYLVDEEFERVFGMNKEKFYAIPVWKRVTLRKDKDLY